jgi:hypothetical protein
VYRAKLRSTGEWVAVKVQRPGVQALVSKDLYVLRRAAEIYQGLITRFAPQQRTNYVALLNEWAVGFYTELDFVNEASNMKRMAEVLREAQVVDVIVPRVYDEYTTRRVLVSQWIDGKKLSDCEPSEIKELIEIGQECFLVQLLQAGFFHSDPHPGNLLRPHDQSVGRLALIDFGLVARIRQEEMDSMVSAIVHLANKDYAALVDDFINLEILPSDCNRGKVIPLMDKALSPYVKGGGAKRYEAELKQMYGMDGTMDATVGGFQAMTQDLLTVLNDIPFSIPPYFALLARAVAFTPAPPASTLARWRDTPTWMAPHAKFVALYDQPFWRDAGLSGTAQSMVGPLAEIHDATTASGRADLFGFVGVAAAQRAALGEAAVVRACVDQLARLFGPAARAPHTTLLKDWAADPLTATAADGVAGGHPIAAATPWVDGAWQARLALAGSETSPVEPGYLAGAVEAATRAVEATLARRGRGR